LGVVKKKKSNESLVCKYWFVWCRIIKREWMQNCLFCSPFVDYRKEVVL